MIVLHPGVSRLVSRLSSHVVVTYQLLIRGLSLINSDASVWRLRPHRVAPKEQRSAHACSGSRLAQFESPTQSPLLLRGGDAPAVALPTSRSPQSPQQESCNSSIIHDMSDVPRELAGRWRAPPATPRGGGGGRAAPTTRWLKSLCPVCPAHAPSTVATLRMPSTFGQTMTKSSEAGRANSLDTAASDREAILLTPAPHARRQQQHHQQPAATNKSEIAL